MTSEIQLRPIPDALFYLDRWNGGKSPVYWTASTYRLADGTIVNYPEVRVRKWNPRYWLLLWRLKRGQRCLVEGACRIPGMVYEAYLGETPNMATNEEMREHVKRVNAPYDWPREGAA